MALAIFLCFVATIDGFMTKSLPSSLGLSLHRAPKSFSILSLQAKEDKDNVARPSLGLRNSDDWEKNMFTGETRVRGIDSRAIE